MGHAAYAELADGSSDFDTRVESPFRGLDDMLALDPAASTAPSMRALSPRTSNAATRSVAGASLRL